MSSVSLFPDVDGNAARLQAWLQDHLEGFGGVMEVERLHGGRSNPGWRLRSAQRDCVLRARPGPRANLLPSAHAIEREFRVQRALAGKKAWITGLRAQQSATREGLPTRTFDESNGLEKYNPLADWTEKEVWAYIKLNKVPYNVLHDKFYPSIGCAPCTRAITPGEDIRSGRWWWENPESKECGLHVKKA